MRGVRTFERGEVLANDLCKVVRGGAHVQEHGQLARLGERKLRREPALLHLLVAELQAIVVEAALPHCDHLALCLTRREHL